LARLRHDAERRSGHPWQGLGQIAHCPLQHEPFAGPAAGGAAGLDVPDLAATRQPGKTADLMPAAGRGTNDRRQLIAASGDTFGNQ
jgi:hypothetical protein